ncbi:MAG: CDP-alcohol phosphatidyltransferase family protein [candidate division NC10 bacterium]|nr:CDP-alcohol phosphatidyltransferase family protein [candidate division NC10 bacterium]
MRIVIDTAIVVCPQPDLPEARLLGVRVAGVPLLTRALLTAQLAGIERFSVVASAPQQAALRGQLDGEARLRGRVRWLEPAEDPGAQSAYSLVLPVSVVLEAGALRGWLRRVVDSGSVTVPDAAGTAPLAVPAGLLSQCIQAALGGQSGLTRFLEKLQGDRRLVTVPWEGIRQQPVRSAAEVPAVERAMLQALRSPEDGPIVDRFVNRALSAFITRGLIRSRVTPNQVTAASLVTGLLGAWLLGIEGALPSLLGLALFQLSVILDHVDGEVARLKFLFSPLGKWLDNVSDHVVDLAVIALLTWRVAGERTAGYFAVLGLAAAIGVTGAFAVVFWWSVSEQPRAARTTAPAQLLAPVLAFLANRDGFSLALWATVPLGRPTWFLWALALGANAYWVAWLLIYGLPTRDPLAVERPAR